MQNNVFPYPDQSQQATTTIVLSNNMRQSNPNNSTLYGREKNQSVTAVDGVQVSRNLSSAQSNSKNGRRRQNNQGQPQQPAPLGITGRSSNMIFQQNGQYFQLINNQPVLIKTQQLNESQLKQIQQLIETQQQITMQSQGGNTLPSIQQYTPLQSQGGKRKTQMMIAGNGAQANKISPQKRVMQGSGQDTQMAAIASNLMPAFQFQGISMSEMASSHSSQRIPNPSYRGSAFSS